MRSFEFHAAQDTPPVVTFNANEQLFSAQGLIVDRVDGLGPVWSDTRTDMIQPQLRSNYYATDQEAFEALWMAPVGSINETDDGSELAPDIFGELFAAQ